MAFTLHLSEDVLKAAVRSPRGFSAYLEDLIARELRKALPGYEVPFAFWIEGAVCPNGTIQAIHLHGAFEIPVGLASPDEIAGLDGYDPDDLLSHNELSERIGDALVRAGGKFERGFGGPQLRFKTMYNPLGWMSYAGKHPLCTLEL